MTKERKQPAKAFKEKDRPAATPERKLGNREAFFHLVHQELFGGPAVLCVSMRIAGPLDIQLVKHACRHLWERHPPLKARIAVRDGTLSFVFDVPFRDIPVHSFFELGKTDVHTIVEREADTLFDASKYLWRVFLITDKTNFERHYLLLSLHHSIGDGACTVHLAGEMVLYCARILMGEVLHVDLLPVRPSLEELAAPARRIADMAPAVTNTLSGGETGNTMSFHEFQPGGRRHTRFRVEALGPARSAALEEQCHRRNTTLRGALAAITLMTMRKHFGNSAGVSVDTPISVRGSEGVGIGDDELWCLETQTGLKYEGTGRSDLWDLARDYSERLLRLTSGGTNQVVDIGHDPAERIEELRGAQSFPLSCLLVDAGRIGPGERSPFILQNIGLVSGRRTADHIMAISLATVGSTLSLTFAYASPLIRESWADRFVNDFLHLAEKALKQDP